MDEFFSGGGFVGYGRVVGVVGSFLLGVRCE